MKKKLARLMKIVSNRSLFGTLFILSITLLPTLPFFPNLIAHAVPVGWTFNVQREFDSGNLDGAEVLVRCDSGSWQSMGVTSSGNLNISNASTLSGYFTASSATCGDGSILDFKTVLDGYVTREIDAAITISFTDPNTVADLDEWTAHYQTLNFTTNHSLSFSHSITITDSQTSDPITGATINAGSANCIEEGSGIYLCPILIADDGATVSVSATGYTTGIINTADRTSDTDSQSNDSGTLDGLIVFTGGTNVSGNVNSSIAITDLQVSGSGNPTVSVHLYVSSGTLSMGTTTGLTFLDTIETGSSLYFSGSLTDINTALATLHFEGQEGVFNLEATLGASSGAVYYPGNGHLYEVIVEESPISANAAKIAADARTFNGISGYLATITSIEENEYIEARLTSSGWIGASDAASEGDWKWIDGPEDGTSFWLGADNGAPVGEQYANWNPGEPNNSGESEDCAEFIHGVGEKWNDLPCGEDLGNPRYSYVVEYGEDGNLPTISNTSLTITVTPENPFDSGSGTGEDPYMISTCSQLQLMNDYLDSSFKLSGDIDCSETATWNINLDEFENGDSDEPLIPDSYSTDTGSSAVVVNNGYYGFQPIGDEEHPFTGRLDGDDYMISNLWIFRKNTERVGLFGSIEDAHILQLNLVDSNIVGSDNTGGLVGFAGANSEITDIDLENNMVRAYLAYNGGGLAGRIEEAANVSNITNTGGTVHGSGSVIGGIVGYLQLTTINNASSSAAVDGGYQVGGFVGNMNQSTITNSSATGNVQSDRLESVLFVKSGYYAGGFVGEMYLSTIEDSYSTGDVDTTGDYAGGFAGSVSDSTITNSYATGAVTGVSETINTSEYIPNYLGGFVGRANSESEIQSSYATGAVTTDGDEVGGFVGTSSCSVVIGYSYATGNVTGDDNVGGFIGFAGCEGPSTDFTQVFSVGNVTGDEYVGGFAGYLSTASVLDAYTSANTVTGNNYVGGFAGSMNYTDTDNVYSRANVVAAGAEFAGGFAGYNFNDGELIEGFWDTTIETGLTGCGNAGGLDCDGVTGKSTIEMNMQAIFDSAGYNFFNVWAIDETNDGYPYFPDMNIAEGPAEILVTTDTATTITQTSVVLNATVTEGSFNAYGFFIGTESYADNEVPAYNQFSEIEDVFSAMTALYPATDGTGSFDVVNAPFDYGTPFESLECGTTYYFRPIVYLGMNTNLGMGIGDEGSFTTSGCSAEVVTEEPVLTSRNFASVGITVTSMPEEYAIYGDYGVVYASDNSELGDESLYVSVPSETFPIEVGEFIIDIEGLTCGTEYTYQAYLATEGPRLYANNLRTFTTDDCGETPEVISVTPTNGATNVSRTTPITIQFSMPMDTEFEPIVSTGPCDGSCPTYDTSWSEDRQTVTLTKVGTPFAYGTTYIISLVNAKNETGDSIGGPEEWSFTTAPVSGGSWGGRGSILVSYLNPQLSPSTQAQTETKNTCSSGLYLTKPIKFGVDNNKDDVKLLENFLNTYEGQKIPVDGIYSKSDFDIVVKWQEKYSDDILKPWRKTKGTGYVFTTSLKKIREIVEKECKGIAINTTTITTTETSSTNQASYLKIQRIKKDLKFGITDINVKTLQQFLIDQNKGPAAVALKNKGMSNYFGKLTKAALVEWQKANGIIPATGNFGEKTRRMIKKIIK